MGVFGKEKKSGSNDWLTGNLDRRKSSNRGIEGGLRNLGNKAVDSATKGVVGVFSEDHEENERIRRARIEEENKNAREIEKIESLNINSSDASVVSDALNSLLPYLDKRHIRQDEITSLAIKKIESGISQLMALNEHDRANFFYDSIEIYRKKVKKNRKRDIIFFICLFVFILIMALVYS